MLKSQSNGDNFHFSKQIVYHDKSNAFRFFEKILVNFLEMLKKTMTLLDSHKSIGRIFMQEPFGHDCVENYRDRHRTLEIGA